MNESQERKDDFDFDVSELTSVDNQRLEEMDKAFLNSLEKSTSEKTTTTTTDDAYTYWFLLVILILFIFFIVMGIVLLVKGRRRRYEYRVVGYKK